MCLNSKSLITKAFTAYKNHKLLKMLLLRSRFRQQSFARKLKFTLLIYIQQFNTHFVTYLEYSVHGFKTLVVDF